MGDFKKKQWQVLFVIILLLPCLFIFGCSCSRDSNNNSSSNGNIYTVIFYTGIDNEFNLPKQEIEDGQKIKKPIMDSRYIDEATQTIKQFVGWYSDPSCEAQYLWKFETDEVHSNLTLYALWEEV